MDKHTLRANALADMRAIIAIEWAKFCLRVPAKEIPDDNVIATDAFMKADIVLGNELDIAISRCHENLTKYMEMKNG